MISVISLIDLRSTHVEELSFNPRPLSLYNVIHGRKKAEVAWSSSKFFTDSSLGGQGKFSESPVN